jgi:plastocyanin
MKLLFLAAIFLLIGTICFAQSKANAQEGEFTITINPGATNSDSLNPINPANITIPVGTTVVWLNQDSAYHQIVSGTPEEGPTNVFYGDFFGTNEGYNRTFDSAGVIDYYDPIWTNIRGQIITVNENNTESGFGTTNNSTSSNFTTSNNANTVNGTSLINESLQPNNINTDDVGSSNSNQSQSGIIGENTQSFTTDQPQQQPIQEPVQQQPIQEPVQQQPIQEPVQQQPIQEPVQQQPIVQNQIQIPQHDTIDSFKANGKINSLIITSSSAWNATGDWNMIVENGEMINFVTNMAWFNGTTGHTHDFLNFDSSGEIELPPDNIVTIDGEIDVASNGVISWDGVESTINIGGGGKTITISVDHEATDHHFAGQPIVGTVTSLTPCSDSPGASMEILPTCS